ncbi:MAG: FAD-dependent oxidoreductase [Solirubrobacterales bacterium]|nr:FAD-dependent oxidoreductase [Solirubrobacterales bacterium]
MAHDGREQDISRRELLRGTMVAGAGLALAGTTPAVAARSPARRRHPSVAVLGGGMAGLAAAHELVERGFDVTVYERNALGGKARSIPVAGTARGGRRDLPGEHGFRFFPGFYHHVPDTMRRIPFGGNPHGVGDNLVPATGGKFLRSGGRGDAGPFGIGPAPESALTPDGLAKLLTEALKQEGVPPHELAYFVNRAVIFLTSCDARRFGQWEHTSWWDFVKAEGKSQEYKTVIAAGLTRNVVAAKETVASTRTIGNMAEAFVWNILGRGNDGALDRVLDLPTNEAWIDPWVVHLRSLGVRFATGRTVQGLEVRGGRITAARTRDRHGRTHRVEADWFVCAMPAERARRLWSPAVLAVDPSLKAMDDLFVDWMVGIQYFLRRKVDITRGHISFIDAPWALTGLTQGQFWDTRDFARDYGDGSVVDTLSVDISDWDAPGVLFGKPAKQCTHDEIAREVWAQVKQHQTAGAVLPDDIVHSWFLDPGIAWVKGTQRNRNDTPLLVNTVGSWEKRPRATTKVPNLFLAGDYVQTNIDLATMEGANESGRAAVNALLEASGSSASHVPMFELYRPAELDAVKRVDAIRERAGQPHILDVA